MMKIFLSFFIFTIVSTITLGQQNTVLNLSSSLRFNTVKKSRFEAPLNQFSSSNQFSLLNKFDIKSVFEDSPNDAYFVNGSKFNSQRNWTNNRKELRIGFGTTQFLGDLGGRNLKGTDYSLRDLNMKSTNLCAMVGYRYRFAKYFATTTSLTIGMLEGSDALIEVDTELYYPDGPDTQAKYRDAAYRKARNLSFRAPFIDITQRLDFIIWQKEKIGARYKFRGLKGFNNRNEQVYIFGGAGLIAFMPQAYYDGGWVRLRPLATEGQGLVGGIPKYSPVTVVMPFGVGFRVGISREWRIGVEASYVKTFSDYIDDVNGVYYDKDKLKDQRGQMAQDLANRYDKSDEEKRTWFEKGQQRGDRQKDAYFYINVVLTKNITYRNYTKVQKRYKLSKGKYKF